MSWLINRNLETLLRNAGIKERATVEEALQELRAVKAEVSEGGREASRRDRGSIDEHGNDGGAPMCGRL